MGNTIIRPLVELITNSADSYKRLYPNKEQKGRIIITYDGKHCEILDNAEGMSKRKLEKSLRYGAFTSGLKKGKKVRGYFGIGLKDACLAVENAEIVTIKDDKITHCLVFLDRKRGPWYEFKKDERGIISDRPVSPEERLRLGIKENGTLIRFEIPEHFVKIKIQKLFSRLALHPQLRKINQSDRYEIIIKNPEGSFNQRLFYIPPEGKVILKDEFVIKTSGTKVKVKMLVKKAERDLDQEGEFREGGLLVFFNEDAVLDCSLFGFDKDPHARKLFGEIELKNFDSLLKKEEPVLSDERKGLDKTHPFVKQLEKEIYKRLKKIIEAEKRLKRSAVTEASFLNLKGLGRINKIASKEIEEPEDILAPPKHFVPNDLGFYYNSIQVPERETKKIILVVNLSQFSRKSTVKIQTNDDRIHVEPEKVRLTSSKVKVSEVDNIPVARLKVSVTGLEKGVEGVVSAECEDKNTELFVSVKENPKLYPKNGFSFVPNETTIVEGKTKKVSLIINRTLFPSAKTVTLESSNETIKVLDKKLNIDNGKLLKDEERIVELLVKIHAHVAGEEGLVIAKLGNKEAELKLKTISSIEKKTRGLFRGIVEDATRNPKELSSYEDGIIYIHTGHPLIKYFREVHQEYRKYVFYWTLITKIAVERICRQIVLEKRNRGKLEVLTSESETIEYEYKNLLYKYGKVFSQALMPLTTLKEGYVIMEERTA